MARCVREEDHEVLARVPRRRDDDAVELEEGRRAADRLACRPVVAFKVGAVDTKRGEDRFIGQVHHSPKLDLELIHGPSCAGAERLNRDQVLRFGQGRTLSEARIQRLDPRRIPARSPDVALVGRIVGEGVTPDGARPAAWTEDRKSLKDRGLWLEWLHSTQA